MDSTLTIAIEITIAAFGYFMWIDFWMGWGDRVAPAHEPLEPDPEPPAPAPAPSAPAPVVRVPLAAARDFSRMTRNELRSECDRAGIRWSRAVPVPGKSRKRDLNNSEMASALMG